MIVKQSLSNPFTLISSWATCFVNPSAVSNFAIICKAKILNSAYVDVTNSFKIWMHLYLTHKSINYESESRNKAYNDFKPFKVVFVNYKAVRTYNIEGKSKSLYGIIEVFSST